jgi:hypothetical protein
VHELGSGGAVLELEGGGEGAVARDRQRACRSSVVATRLLKLNGGGEGAATRGRQHGVGAVSRDQGWGAVAPKGDKH